MTRLYTRLPLDNVRNCRELGGIPTLDKSIIRWKRFIRSGNINQASLDDMNMLKNYGVKHIIDLRTLGDIESDAKLEGKYDNFIVHNINLFGKERIKKEKDKDSLVVVETEEKLKNLYQIYLKNHKDLKKIFDLFLEYPDETFLFHCGIGKDRTGIISLLILGLADVGITDILANYEVSKTYLRTDISEKMAYGFEYDILNSDANNMKYAYDLVRENYGSFFVFFKVLGYSEEEVETLKWTIIEREENISEKD